MERLRTIAGRVAKTFLVAAVPAAAAGGCATFAGLTKDMQELTSLTAAAPASQIACTWQNRLTNLPDPMRNGAPTPGIAGQIFLYDGSYQPVEATGELTVSVSDASPRPPGQVGPNTEVWHFSNATLKNLRLVDERIGRCYVVFLPWPDTWRDVSRVKFQVRYDQPNGTTLYAQEADVQLDFSPGPNGPIPGTGGGSVPNPADLLKQARAAQASGQKQLRTGSNGVQPAAYSPPGTGMPMQPPPGYPPQGYWVPNQPAPSGPPQGYAAPAGAGYPPPGSGYGAAAPVVPAGGSYAGPGYSAPVVPAGGSYPGPGSYARPIPPGRPKRADRRPWPSRSGPPAPNSQRKGRRKSARNSNSRRAWPDFSRGVGFGPVSVPRATFRFCTRPRRCGSGMLYQSKVLAPRTTAMQTVTFLVLEGVDKGRVFRDMAVPISIGREEGNTLRLNDERVSRWHAKIQTEDGDVILTDLDSTNGTRVNGSTIQIRRLRAGDQVSIGRTMLLFGTMDEIAARRNAVATAAVTSGAVQTLRLDELKAAKAAAMAGAPAATLTVPANEWSPREEDVPPLPQKLTGSQAARLAEIFDHLHRGMTLAIETMEESKEDGTEIKLGFAEWQMIQAVHGLLARYSRQIAEPDGD